MAKRGIALLEGNGELLAPCYSSKLASALAPIKLRSIKDIEVCLLHKPDLGPIALLNVLLNLGVRLPVAQNV
jgi:hypothetical protein